ncbi:MAG: iron-sulfur cluster repair di-iron protein [Bacteroidota bacterium]
MEINRETRIGDIVKENYRTARIFDRNGIDFCCGGGISLAQACEKSNTDMDALLPELEALLVSSDPDSVYINSLALDELCTYIEKRHHYYIKGQVPFLQQKLSKLCDVHGQNHAELFEIKELFEGAAGNLSAHMQKEELILFPAIRKMMKFNSENKGSNSGFGKLGKIIETLDTEHQTEGERFERISSLSNQYTCPPDGCNTFKITYQTLKDFEQDLHRHIHLENNVLFKKAIVLEQELTAGRN